MCKLRPEVIIDKVQENSCKQTPQEQMFSLTTHSARCCHQNLRLSKHQNSVAPDELMYCCILMQSIKMVISLGAVAHLISRRCRAHRCLCSSHRPSMNYLSKSVLSLSLLRLRIAASLHKHFILKKHTGNTSRILTAISKDMIRNLCTFRNVLIASTDI